jgi:hypothetical protein
MKLITGSILLLSIASCHIPFKTNSLVFYITFGSCFHSNNLDLKIGNHFEIKNINLVSDFATGIVLDKSISYNGSDLKFIVENKEMYREPYKVINRKLTIQAKNGADITQFEVDLAKGKYIFIENCGTMRPLELKQYRKKPIVE